ncbi:DNA-binding protein [Aureimonas sp. SA4125]|uniref:type II toxin-antitoxin system VapC family toxin n=1 Tax=Aureimonas sp. SA4125 TaxID=2826993 RepID=UPI001CC43B66|nr:type II toxin-antitoxin system VapC family toxin [Aureimonas sp. SA4125]BDA83221.1 DNA-binding protein [Aureimonas sp. SA4125]
MATLCDTNILIDLYGESQHWNAWSRKAVAAARRSGPLVINPIVYAEFSIGYTSVEAVDAVLDARVFDLDALPWAAAFDAARAFVAYHRQGGEKRSSLPDFCIGAHAMYRGYRMLTRNPSRYRAYFPDLELISPETQP